MRVTNLIVCLVVAIFWIVSLTLIAAPDQIVNSIIGGMSTQQHEVLGLTTFLMSLLIITLWAVSTDEKEEKALTTNS